MNYIKRPFPEIGKQIRREKVIERIVEKPSKPSEPIDISALAKAIALAMQTISPNNPINTDAEDFDNTKTLEKLAKSMTVQRGNNESNFDNLGNEHHTKTNKEETDKTIDLLSNLND